MQPTSSPLLFYTSPVASICQSVSFLLTSNNIPHDPISLNLHKGDQNNPDFKRISPLGKVPAILDRDFPLIESNTILRYLCNAYPVADHWYPKDPKKQALVNMFFDWHGARFADFEKEAFVKVNEYWKERKEGELEEARKVSEGARKEMEEVFLKGRRFLASEEEMTIADLAVVWGILWAKEMGIEFGERIEEWYGEVGRYKGMGEKMEEYRGALRGMMERMKAAKAGKKEGSGENKGENKGGEKKEEDKGESKGVEGEKKEGDK